MSGADFQHNPAPAQEYSLLQAFFIFKNPVATAFDGVTYRPKNGNGKGAIGPIRDTIKSVVATTGIKEIKNV